MYLYREKKDSLRVYLTLLYLGLQLTVTDLTVALIVSPGVQLIGPLAH